MIGDDLNDIPMLEKYNGYAVNNAQAEVKAVSLKIYNSVSDLISAVS
ncbi:MAG: hydroxymethylpyrimidine pyrophosphatase-like HAD family hydrolase [Psychromonas sp.]